MLNWALKEASLMIHDWIHSWHFLVEISQAFLVSNSVHALYCKLLKTVRRKAIKVAGSEVVTHCSPRSL